MVKETDNTKIAVISTTLGYIQRDIANINSAIQGLSGVYETKDEAISRGKIIDDRILALEKQSNLWKWLGPTLSAAVALVVGFLIENFLLHLH